MNIKNIDPKQRRRPRQARANHTVETILEAAAHVLDEHGESSFTTNQIAERAGISIGSLYQYFANKQAILIAIAERAEDTLNASAEQTSPPTKEQESRLRLGLRSYIQMLPENPVTRLNALTEILKTRGPEGVAQMIDQRCHESGLYSGLTETDRFVVSRAITGVVQSAVREQTDHLHSRAFEDSLVKLVRAFLRASD
ncbi:MAG: TetR/AcrR family transcriptional regulator [Pseudomonadota bacterium]